MRGPDKMKPFRLLGLRGEDEEGLFTRLPRIPCHWYERHGAHV